MRPPPGASFRPHPQRGAPIQFVRRKPTLSGGAKVALAIGILALALFIIFVAVNMGHAKG
jgi:hypothetical protein